MSKRGEKIQADVFAVLRGADAPMSAYAVLGRLRDDNPRLAPPTIYRALAALTAQGRVHRLESLNAFIACKCDRHREASILSICDDCGLVEEHLSTAILRDVTDVASASGFTPNRHIIEVLGLCASCTSGAKEKGAAPAR